MDVLDGAECPSHRRPPLHDCRDGGLGSILAKRCPCRIPAHAHDPWRPPFYQCDVDCGRSSDLAGVFRDSVRMDWYGDHGALVCSCRALGLERARLANSLS